MFLDSANRTQLPAAGALQGVDDVMALLTAVNHSK